MIRLGAVLSTHICPDRAHVRTVLAGIFNRDVRTDAVEELTPVEAIVILASKMLLDMGHKSGYVQAIFRLNKTRLLERRFDGELPVILSISDNRYAMVFGGLDDVAPIYDYITGELSASPGTPLLQMSINLTKLLEMIRETGRSLETHLPAEGS
jgi:hypothetical protein